MDSKAECVADSLVDSFAERWVRVNGFFQFFVCSLKVDRKAELSDELGGFRPDDVSADQFTMRFAK
jgi:hypothetical protein